jgi:lipopolysaccharide/colanic/teichoic acid biosynthesis glycosyltransferase
MDGQNVPVPGSREIGRMLPQQPAAHGQDAPEPRRSKTWDARLRRGVDIVAAGLALALFAPLMLTIAVAVRLESRGPVFFRQTRIGQGGRRFGMYKFRKFHIDAGEAGSPLTLERDPRLTQVGRLLMATKFDELPQFWNVLRGDMAIVGPRPESLAFSDCFKDGWEELLHHKPGLLGPCQIVFRNEAAVFPNGADAETYYRAVLFPTKARIDVDYFRDRNLASDAGIILRGVLAICGAVAPASAGLVRVEAASRADATPAAL